MVELPERCVGVGPMGDSLRAPGDDRAAMVVRRTRRGDPRRRGVRERGAALGDDDLTGQRPGRRPEIDERARAGPRGSGTPSGTGPTLSGTTSVRPGPSTNSSSAPAMSLVSETTWSWSCGGVGTPCASASTVPSPTRTACLLA